MMRMAATRACAASMNKLNRASRPCVANRVQEAVSLHASKARMDIYTVCMHGRKANLNMCLCMYAHPR